MSIIDEIVSIATYYVHYHVISDWNTSVLRYTKPGKWLSGQTSRAIGPRCKRYGSPDRLEDGPLLVVAYNELAEQHFQEAGRLYDLKMLTTTLGRLAEAGVASPGVWSHYGTPVTLRA